MPTHDDPPTVRQGLAAPPRARYTRTVKRLLALLTLTACAHGPSLSRVQVVCPPEAEVYVEGTLRGVHRGEAQIPYGNFQLRCEHPKTGQFYYQNLVVQAPVERFDFADLPWTAEEAPEPVEEPEPPAAESQENTLSKPQLFKQGAPATLMLLAYRQGTGVGTGVIVSPDGLVVTNKHVVKNARKVIGFLYDPEAGPSSTSLREFVGAHKEKAKILTLVREHPRLDLALLRLPKAAAPYPYIEPHTAGALEVGEEVIAIGNPDGLSWTLTSGNVSQIRKDAIQHQAPINPGNSGGPLLDRQGRLVGINTYIRNSVERQGGRQVAFDGLGFALPADEVTSLIKGGTIYADREDNLDDDDPPDGKKWTPTRVQVALLTGAMKHWLDGNAPRAHSLQAAADIMAATNLSGRSRFTRPFDGDWINSGLSAALTAIPEPQQGQATQLLHRTWPRGFRDSQGYLWLLQRAQGRYQRALAVRSWTIDDTQGDLYAVKGDGQLYQLRPSGAITQAMGLGGVLSVQASEGRLYAMGSDRRIQIYSQGKWRRLGRSTVAAELLATRGHLYVLDKDKDLFHLDRGNWANGGNPIANNVMDLAASGGHWYGLDKARRVYSGDLGRYIDRDGDAAAVTAIGRDLLLFTRDTKLYRFRMAERRWEGSND